MNINVTLRFSWCFLQFVYISDILITFDDFTSCWVCWLQVTFFINFTYCVVTCWNQFISLTFEFNLLWTVVYNCVVVFVYWLSFFVSYIFLDGLAFCIHIVNIDVTLRFFFHFVYIGDVLIAFDHFTCCRVCWLEVTLIIYFTDSVSSCWYQFISLTFEFNLLWAVVYHCIVVFIHWLSFFVSNIWLDGLAFCIYIVNIDVTLRFFFHFVYIGDVLIAFDHFTCCRVCWLEVTLIIYFTDSVSSCWYQFISLTFEFNLLWAVVYHCIVVFIHWLSFFVSNIWLDGLAFCIYIVNIDVTLRLFFQFVDVGDILILFSNFSSCRIWRLQVTLVIYFTNCVVACWYQFIGLASFFYCLWAVVYDCVIVFVNWLLIFVSYRIFKGCSFSIFIVNEDISFNIRLDKVVVHISWWFNRSWNWVVVWEWRVTLQIRVYFTIWCCRVIRYRSFCLDFWNFTSNDVVTVITWSSRCQCRVWSTFEWTWISV